jgi:hypothetical protein
MLIRTKQQTVNKEEPEKILLASLLVHGLFNSIFNKTVNKKEPGTLWYTRLISHKTFLKQESFNG